MTKIEILKQYCIDNNIPLPSNNPTDILKAMDTRCINDYVSTEDKSIENAIKRLNKVVVNADL